MYNEFQMCNLFHFECIHVSLLATPEPINLIGSRVTVCKFIINLVHCRSDLNPYRSIYLVEDCSGA